MKAQRLILIAALLVTSVFVLNAVPTTAQAQADEISEGCAALNDPSHDGVYSGGSAILAMYYAGERIVITVDYGEFEQPLPTGQIQRSEFQTSEIAELYDNGALRDSDSIPGTLTYTFPQDKETIINWTAYTEGVGDWNVRCIPVDAVEELEPAPGCDMVYIPYWAVVGSFVDTVVLNYAPAEGAGSDAVMAAGKTAWVFGVDESGAYYKILWGCGFYWVPVETMGPNFDEVWNGAPLPVEVVD